MADSFISILGQAKNVLHGIRGQIFDVISIAKPKDIYTAVDLSKIISKLSPILGNMIEFSIVNELNAFDWRGAGKWVRQDPEFPDALFKSDIVKPNAGIEIKAWFPLATEITARFRDSINIVKEGNIDIALVAWLPENVIWGKPKIIDILVVSAKSVAQSRDNHYHKPPDYIILEPFDTKERTSNLQQTNTSGYKIQENKNSHIYNEAINEVTLWGENCFKYTPNEEYQRKLRGLQSKYRYRLDTNYAKIDRIENADIENFKNKVLNTVFCGRKISSWAKALTSKENIILESALQNII